MAKKKEKGFELDKDFPVGKGEHDYKVPDRLKEEWKKREERKRGTHK